MNVNYNEKNIEINDNVINKKRKYNSEFRKKFVLKVKKIKNKELFYKIFELSKKEIGNKYTENNNGIFYNINKLSDDLIEELNNVLNSDTETNQSSDLKFEYTPYSVDKVTTLSEYGNNLSNKEKNLLKQNNF